jgi:hypothetical protein
MNPAPSKYLGIGIGNGNVASVVIGYCVKPIPKPEYETLPTPIPKTKKELFKGAG